MVMKKFTLLLTIIAILGTSTMFLSSGGNTELAQGAYNVTGLGTSGTYNISYSDPLNPTNFAFNLNSSHGQYTLTKAKLQEVIDNLSNISSSIPGQFTPQDYQRQEMLQNLNQVMTVFNNPASFDSLVQRVKLNGSATLNSSGTNTFGTQQINSTIAVE
jgi:hypothetical protein